MANIVDISGRITNELPMVRISETLCVTVNNRKSTVLNVQAMINELTRDEAKRQKEAAEKGTEYEPMPETEMMNKALKMIIGEKNTEAIEEMDLPIPEYKIVYEAIMNCATGNYNAPSEQ